MTTTTLTKRLYTHVGPTTRNCTMCGKEFTVPRASYTKKTCSKVCSMEQRKITHKAGFEQVTKPCDVCSKKFTVSHSLRNKRTCSLECLKKLRRVYVVTCRQCGKEITPGKISHTRVFCDTVCRDQFIADPANHHFYNPDRIRICKNCGKTFEAASEKKKRGMICSRACYMEWVRKHGRTHRASLGHVTSGRNSVRKYVKIGEGKYQLEHRYVVEKHLGRPLHTAEVIHHINGNPADNRLENLLLTNQSNHIKIHKEAEKIGLSVMAAENWLPTVEGMAC
jgi:HNH endonuclease